MSWKPVVSVCRSVCRSLCRPAVLAVAAVSWLGACSAAGAGSTTATTATTATTVPVATELAETQVSASTVAPPATPGPCEPADIEVINADPGAGADQVIDLVNRGTVRCEVDLSDSPDADEDLEPNVVLGPGELAHLWISEATACQGGNASPPADFVLRVNGTVRALPLTFAPQCGIELWAFFTD